MDTLKIDKREDSIRISVYETGGRGFGSAWYHIILSADQAQELRNWLNTQFCTQQHPNEKRD